MICKSFAALLAIVTVVTTSIALPSAANEVRFTSDAGKPSAFREKLARQRGETLPPYQGVPLAGFLSRPKGDGPFPAIVILHGCGGLGPRLKDDVSGRLVSQGYVVLVVDSFATRQMKSTCATTERDVVFTISDRVYDAYGALDFLSKEPFVDASRVALMGFSAGGVTALTATKAGGVEQLQDKKFKAAVAYYPTCSATDGEATVPTLIMAGELDDWGPPAKCRQKLTNLSEKGSEIRLIVYPGAFHDFDVPTAKPGTVYFGHRLEYNASATVQANKDVDSFLQQELRN